MNIVMPMAGRGSRFAQIGIATPKPLIRRARQADVCLGHRGLAAVAGPAADLHLPGASIWSSGRWNDDIRTRYAQYDPAIIALDEVTEGQACTVLTAREWIDNDEPLLIFNADTYCPTTLEQSLEAMGPTVDGVLDVFRADGRQVELCPRRRAGSRAGNGRKASHFRLGHAPGLYYFRRGRDFVRHAEAMIAANERSNNEFYVAPVYNRLIAAGRRHSRQSGRRGLGAWERPRTWPISNGSIRARRRHESSAKSPARAQQRRRRRGAEHAGADR